MHEHKAQPALRQDTSASRLKFSLLVLSVVFVGEVVGGYLSNSLALLSDAGHVFTDLLALALAWVAVKQASRLPTPQMTYGYHRVGILFALLNALSLLGIAGFIFVEGYSRWQQPQAVNSPLMLGVAFLGLLANLLVVNQLYAHTKGSLVVRSAFWHALGDSLSSVGVILAGGIIYFTGWFQVDALASFLVGAILLLGARGIFKEGLQVLLEAPPSHTDSQEIAQTLSQVSGVKGVHDLHIWSIASGLHLLSCHLQVDDIPLSEGTRIASSIRELLKERYNIAHSTLQLECPGCEAGVCSWVEGGGRYGLSH